MKIVVVTPPSGHPVTVADLKAHAQITHDADDALLPLLIGAAVQAVERHTGLLLMPQVVDVTTTATLGHLPVAPVREIESVHAITRASPQVLVEAGWWVDPADGRLGIYPHYGAHGYVARVAVGYADAASVPHALRAAILMVATDLYENRSAQIVGVSAQVNPTVNRLLFPFRHNLGV